MPNKEQLLEMNPSEIWRSAVSEGLYAARKISAYGKNSNAVTEWFQTHPEYADFDVKVLLETGEKLEFEEILREASEKGVVVWNNGNIYLPKK